MQVVSEAAVQARSSHSVSHSHAVCSRCVSSRRAQYIGRCDSHADLDIPEGVSKSPLQAQQASFLRYFWDMMQLSGSAVTAGLERPVAPAALACSTATGEKDSGRACSLLISFDFLYKSSVQYPERSQPQGMQCPAHCARTAALRWHDKVLCLPASCTLIGAAGPVK